MVNPAGVGRTRTLLNPQVESCGYSRLAPSGAVGSAGGRFRGPRLFHARGYPVPSPPFNEEPRTANAAVRATAPGTAASTSVTRGACMGTHRFVWGGRDSSF